MAALSKYKKLFLVRQRNFLKGNCSVLLYHRVDSLTSDRNQLAITPDEFYEQMRFLKKQFNVLEVEEFDYLRSKEKRFPDRSILISFDDGYRDNDLYARPILESLNLQALFFIATGYVSSQQEFWWDQLERFIFQDKEIVIDQPDGGINKFKTTEEKNLVFTQLNTALRKMLPSERDRYISTFSLENSLPACEPDKRAMNWSQLNSFASSKAVVIGAHTVQHASLNHLSALDGEEEIIGSKRELEMHLGKTVNHFAFPYGSNEDFSDVHVSFCIENGLPHVFGSYRQVFSNLIKGKAIPRMFIKPINHLSFQQKMRALLWHHDAVNV